MLMLLRAKTIFPCCGVYITSSSFSSAALTTMRDARISEGLMIIPIDENDSPKLIEKGFKAFLQEKCDKMLAKA
jgi:hypothetical protein